MLNTSSVSEIQIHPNQMEREDAPEPNTMFFNCCKTVGGFPTGTSGFLRATRIRMALCNFTPTGVPGSWGPEVALRLRPPHVLLREGWGEAERMGPGGYVPAFNGTGWDGEW